MQAAPERSDGRWDCSVPSVLSSLICVPPDAVTGIHSGRLPRGRLRMTRHIPEIHAD
ncbi:hypothetical protein E4U54_008483, partial [Claviceps lovelessii]